MLLPSSLAQKHDDHDHTHNHGHHGSPLKFLIKLIAPGMVAGLAFGRLGCLLNGCCYGGETDVPWAVTFPRERAEGEPTAPYAETTYFRRLISHSMSEWMFRPIFVML